MTQADEGTVWDAVDAVWAYVNTKVVGTRRDEAYMQLNAIRGVMNRVRETDIIAIPRDELPDVFVTEGVGPTVVANGLRHFTYGDSPSELREVAAGLLALAEYVTAHPQVSEAQVEALAQDLVGSGLFGSINARAVARHLIAEHWKKEQP